MIFTHKYINVNELINFIEPDTTIIESPCQPSPCGPNSKCQDSNGQAICSCALGYFGLPPSCRPECVLSSECSFAKACVNQKCLDPCVGACGSNAACHVNNHSPVCFCDEGFTGSALIKCYPVTVSERKISL